MHGGAAREAALEAGMAALLEALAATSRNERVLVKLLQRELRKAEATAVRRPCHSLAPCFDAAGLTQLHPFHIALTNCNISWVELKCNQPEPDVNWFAERQSASGMAELRNSLPSGVARRAAELDTAGEVVAAQPS